MSIGLPQIDITFNQKSNTAIQRSERGVACIIVLDDSLGDSVTVKTYKYATDIKTTDYTEENYPDIQLW